MRSLRILGQAVLAVALLTMVSIAVASADDKEKTEPDVVFVPTPQEVVDKMLELAKVTKKDIMYDLGCGDGRIVCTAARKYGCKATGIDIDPDRIKDSEASKKKEKADVQ